MFFSYDAWGVGFFFAPKHRYDDYGTWMLKHGNKSAGLLNTAFLSPLNLQPWLAVLEDIPRATAEEFKAMPRITIELSGNPWETPPWKVIQGGWDQVVSFYEGLAQSGGEVVPSLKVVLVGAVRAGKTTLTRGLLNGEIARTLPPRTRGVDVHKPWVPDFDPPLEVVIWDFAGHDDYYSTHQVSRLDLWFA